jgi:hypothetical protein
MAKRSIPAPKMSLQELMKDNDPEFQKALARLAATARKVAKLAEKKVTDSVETIEIQLTPPVIAGRCPDGEVYCCISIGGVTDCRCRPR